MKTRRKSGKKTNKAAVNDDLYFTLTTGHIPFSWNFKDHLAVFNLSSEKSQNGFSKTQKLRFKKDLSSYKESFRKHHSLDDEILQLFTHDVGGKIHQIRNAHDENDFLSFCINERNIRKYKQDMESSSSRLEKKQYIKLGFKLIKSQNLNKQKVNNNINSKTKGENPETKNPIRVLFNLRK
jgi:hypothetical protein